MGQYGRNCNPFGNVATVTSQCVVQDVALVEHADMFIVSVISFI